MRVTFTDELPVAQERTEDLVALDDALDALARVDKRKSKVIELRFFGGLTVQETAAVLKLSPESVLRDSRFAKAWLMKQLRGESAGGT